jgi:hypothetical protein
MLLLAAVSGCGASYPTLPADVKQISIDGVAFAAPADGPWQVSTHNAYAITLGKNGKGADESIIIDAFDFRAPALEPGKDFIATTKEQEERDTPAPRFVMKLHEVQPVTIGTATCARSHMIAEDHAPQVPGHSGKMMILEVLSLNCLHPDHPDVVAFNVGYSERGYPGDEDPDFMKNAMALMDSVRIIGWIEGHK